MEANIVVSGVPRRADPQDHARRVTAAVDAFRRRFPGAIIEEPRTEPVGRTSQTITFAVKASDLKSAQSMQRFFEQSLMMNGFSPTDNAEDARAGAEDLLRRIAGDGAKTAYVSEPPRGRSGPWWKFW